MRKSGPTRKPPLRLALALLALALHGGLVSGATFSFVLAPNSAPQGTTLDVAANTGIPLSGTLSFEPAGLTISNPRLDAKKHLVFTLTIPPNAVAGPYTFVYQPATLATLAAVTSTFRQQNAFTVTSAPHPAIRSITPDHIFSGDTDVHATITGAFFRPGTTLTVGGGVTARVLLVQNGEMLTASFTADATAAPGPRTVIISNSDGRNNANQRPPALLVVLFLPPRATPTLTPTGTPTRTPTASPTVTPTSISSAAPQPTATPTPSPTPSSTPTPSPTSTSAPRPVVQPFPTRLAESPTPTLTPTQTQTPTLTPRPTRPTEILKGPRVDTVEPSVLLAGGTYDLKFTGKNFALSSSISLGPDVQFIGRPFVISPTEATVRVQVSLAAPPGVRAAVAADADGTNSGPGGVMIGSGLPPLEAPRLSYEEPPEPVVVASFTPPADPTARATLEREEPDGTWKVVAGPIPHDTPRAVDVDPPRGRLVRYRLTVAAGGLRGPASLAAEILLP